MNTKLLQQQLVEYCKSIGVTHIGFTHADPFESLKTKLIISKQKGYASGFEEPDVRKRT
ncbi:MAG: tRNA epoxyqueuosine(34) reductase QueG, partial [Bacilli bacterium]